MTFSEQLYIPVCGYCCIRPVVSGQTLCPSCADYLDKIEQAQKAFVEAHPDYCTGCGGTGFVVIKGTRYHRDGSGEPDITEECECLAEERCPWCGEHHTIGEERDGRLTCSACDWHDQAPGYPQL